MQSLFSPHHKGGLAFLMVIGFIIGLPIWYYSTPEEQQRVTQDTATMRIVEHHIGMMDVAPEVEQDVKAILSQPAPESSQPIRDAWVERVSQRIVIFGNSEHEAKEIARWVWVYSQRHEIRPELILALITVESRFDPFAVSNVGALGLMQVMPFWKDSIGAPNDNLFDVATNIRYGCAILKHYLTKYRTETRALAAYNGSLGYKKYPNKIFSQIKNYE
ncbi:MAG: hypothetical protein AUK35_03505 [Zetaproteobacteria bacterium CG2_30_46_52]|nr:MAG: hypothetical protein AUK35_03505 [Zetaproteobacteria bacterium CG2_30_46_52]